MIITKKDIAARLKVQRVRLNISQSEVARRIGMTSSAISLLEIGRTYPSFTTLSKLAALFQVSFVTLLVGDEAMLKDKDYINQFEGWLGRNGAYLNALSDTDGQLVETMIKRLARGHDNEQK